MAKGRATSGKGAPGERDCRHPTRDLPLRPEVGKQAQFKKKKAPKTYRDDPSLRPVFEWDGQNPARQAGEALIRQILEAGTLDEALAYNGLVVAWPELSRLAAQGATGPAQAEPGP